jgi:hypothetical protein
MSRAAGSGKCRWMLKTLAAGVACLSLTTPAVSGPYRDSAHGNSVYGVNRSAIDPKFVEYATGNCAHCHEMHASIGGVEPAPSGGASPHALFAPAFNTERTQHFYIESDNFCFHCHSSTSGQQVINQDYSGAFGGATVGGGPQSIMEAFNLESYHNLYDIWNLLRNNLSYPWFDQASNPCSACHNPHLAKRNWDSSQPGFPLLSAISTPSDPTRLWGETELMSAHNSYEAPYAFGETREPAGFGQADGERTPDYVNFCATCHNNVNIIWSTTLNRNVRNVDWRATGLTQQDKHGARARDRQHPDATWGQRFAEPYNTSLPFKNNLVLSCMDCHEAHGSENIMLLRRRANGVDLGEVMTAATPKPLLALCIRCHNQEYVNKLHHEPGYLVPGSTCTTCHPNGETQPEVVACRQCHFHGSNL